MGIKLSACTITKNEELNIGKSIDSYKDYVDEIIIVDTGSIDNTVEVAKSKGAKVFNFEWKNDFSAAKNFAIDKATGDWIIFLDADEWFADDSAKNIQEAIKDSISSNYDAVACKIINYFTETEIMETASTIRIFKHADNIRFNRAIHETLFDLNKNTALPGLYSELLAINHSGYMKDLLEKKAKRNKALLDRYFALGDVAPIDYFYGLRENLKEDTDVSEYFYNLINNTPNYDELISTFNISTSIEENKLKLVNSLPNKYSFDYRVNLLKEMQEKYNNNPMFKFYEYKLFENVDKKKAMTALQEAVELDKKFAEENLAANNAFIGKRSEVYSALGEYYIFINDKLQALDYFTKAIKADYTNLDAFNGILYTVSNEKSEDIILFIKSIYDVENKEVGKFLVDALRLTKFKDVFLYYFVDYYKKHEEVDRAFFTSRLLTGNFDEMVDKYIKVYKESKDERALLLVSAALICGECKEKFSEVIENFSPAYLNILNAYFEDQKMTQMTEVEFQYIFNIIREIAYIASDDTLEKILNICDVAKERLKFEFIKHYYFQYSYDLVLKWGDKFESSKNIEKDLSIYLNYLRANIYFINNDFEKIPDVLDKVVYSGLLKQNIIYICEILEADDEKLKEYFELFDTLNFARINFVLDNIEDVKNDAIKFITVDKFKEDIESKTICLVDEHLRLFFDFAEKLKKQKAFYLAEKYYKILVKYGYKLDKAYYSLGEIYNNFDKPELSYYCYENAFIENFRLARDILPKGHVNSSYVFSKKPEVEIENCPICGGASKDIKTYVNIADKNLTYNQPVIIKYRCCNDCNHIFASNDILDKIYWENNETESNNDDRILGSYDILESVCEITDGVKLLDLSKGNEFKVAAENYGFEVHKEGAKNKFDIIYASETLNNIYDTYNVLYDYVKKLVQDGIIIFEIFDKDNAFSKLADKPLWAKSNVKNVFSKKSMEVLFNKVGLQILQINIDKVNKGKIIVFAGIKDSIIEEK